MVCLCSLAQIVLLFPADFLDYQNRNSDRQMPYLLSCALPPDTSHGVPLAVSLVSEPCAPASNLLKVPR
ncbi:hypothetical protein E2C01_092638 [Portunus trituberculatus]|uniref:Secreted protein n=1 Tax=Portunus trituberculatus TaxID=210409 RepID=A0A5B7JVZ3_PORTR|nr:hypothetical protein [Portunus trituberculatus]